MDSNENKKLSESDIVAKVDALMSLCDTLKVRLVDAPTTQLHLADARRARCVQLIPK